MALTSFGRLLKSMLWTVGCLTSLRGLKALSQKIYDDPAGKFLLCSADFSDVCVVVYLAKGWQCFRCRGPAESALANLMVEDFVTVIGRYRQDDTNNMENTGVDEKFAFDAIVIEIGGNASQVKGTSCQHTR